MSFSWRHYYSSKNFRSAIFSFAKIVFNILETVSNRKVITCTIVFALCIPCRYNRSVLITVKLTLSTYALSSSVEGVVNFILGGFVGVTLTLSNVVSLTSAVECGPFSSVPPPTLSLALALRFEDLAFFFGRVFVSGSPWSSASVPLSES